MKIRETVCHENQGKKISLVMEIRENDLPPWYKRPKIPFGMKIRETALCFSENLCCSIYFKKFQIKRKWSLLIKEEEIFFFLRVPDYKKIVYWLRRRKNYFQNSRLKKGRLYRLGRRKIDFKKLLIK